MTHKPTLLIVDDDAPMREMLDSLFREKGLATVQASSADEALERVRELDIDAVLSDIRMPGKSGIELVGELRAVRPEVPVVMMTAFGSIDSAVEAVRAGAFDYITKPFEVDAVTLSVERALERRALEVENQQLRRVVSETGSLGDLVGRSAAMRDVIATIRKVASGRANVLITGETGTGKEVVARTLHFHGVRADKPFIPINCTAIPEALLESELFGHVRGAYTGAHASKRGLFEQAQGGTIFLDEIGDMGPELQGKLLRVLQDRMVRRVGGTDSVRVDVRIIAATHRDLPAEIEAGRFREDLYYRLNVIPIHVAPLRERREDIPALVKAFLLRHGGPDASAMSPAAMRELMRQEWRGNARELENVIERALALSDAPEIGVEDLPLALGAGSAGFDSAESLVEDAREQRLTLRELQDRYIDAILELTGGNKVHAARILGIDRKTLYRREVRNPGAARHRSGEAAASA